MLLVYTSMFYIELPETILTLKDNFWISLIKFSIYKDVEQPYFQEKCILIGNEQVGDLSWEPPTLKVTSPHVGHVTNWYSYIFTFKRLMPATLGRVLTWKMKLRMQASKSSPFLFGTKYSRVE